MTPPYPFIHIVINPASGKNQPMLNIINDVCRKHEVEWDATVTHKFGDATAQALAAIAAGVDLIAGYGGDGTQHEVANAILTGARSIPMAILPGGTGNGFCRENGVPEDLQAAVELMCTSANLRHVDAVRLGNQYFIQRLYTGIEPEQQTSRELKDKYGVLAYAFTVRQQAKAVIEAQYRLTIDGQVVEANGTRCYIINSGMSGKGLTLDQNFSVTDGLLDVILLNRDLAHVEAVAERFLHVNRPGSGLHYWRGKEITIDSDPDRPVWTDGEYSGRTPITATVMPGALAVVVP
jgi:YegS/Rv2252/BmrU family lipid kinase